MNAKKTILVPTDFSNSARSALDWATMLARECGAQLLIMHVKPLPVLSGGDDDVFDPEETDLRRKLEQTRPDDVRVRFEHHLLHGTPTHEIIHLSEKEHVDLIVMGAHGETGHTERTMGAVAQGVINQSKCPVLTFFAPRYVAATM